MDYVNTTIAMFVTATTIITPMFLNQHSVEPQTQTKINDSITVSGCAGLLPENVKCP